MVPKDDSTQSGNCFEAAANFISRDEIFNYPDDYRLVHGNVAKLRQDEAVNHAWIEEGDLVHEVSNGRHELFSKETYYAWHGITKVRRYTVHQALLLLSREGHSGPWDDASA